jgi:hypothetical protein
MDILNDDANNGSPMPYLNWVFLKPVKLKTHCVDLHLQDVMLSGGSDAAIIPIGESSALLFSELCSNSDVRYYLEKDATLVWSSKI